MLGWIAVAVIGAYLVVEGLLRRGKEARSLAATTFDQGTTRASGLVFALAGFGAPLTSGIVVRLPLAVGIAGLVLMAAGLGLRVWAAATLGRFYTRTLRIVEAHALVEEGPYALVRHPGYLGVMAIWTGYGLAWRGVISVVLAAVPVIVLYIYRLALEERMLGAALPHYQAYRRRTRRLLPGVW